MVNDLARGNTRTSNIGADITFEITLFQIQPSYSKCMQRDIKLTLTAEKYRSVTINNWSTPTAKFMIEFIRRITLFKTLSDDRRTLANALVKVSESKLDMSKGFFFTRGPI